MPKNVIAVPRLTHISLALVGLMWVFPFLHVRHEYPLTTFYQEWWSAVLGVLAMVLLIERDYWRRLEVPRIAQLPVAMMGVVILQWLLGRMAYLDQAVLYILYLLFAALLMLLGARLRDCYGLAHLSRVLAIVLLIGAELNALVGMLQHYGWHTKLDTLIVAKIGAAVYGNLAQPNHFAHYIVLGMISLGYLFQLKRLNGMATALLALPMLFVAAMSGSRSVWLYLAWMLVMAWGWSRRDIRFKPLLYYCVWLLLGFALMHWVVQAPVLSSHTGSINTVGRLLAEQQTTSIRMYLWREAAMMFMQFPLFGAGFGQFAWQHFQLVPILRPDNILGLYNNAHNLVMQLAAETGTAGLLIFFASLAVWVRGIRHNAGEAEHWWGYASLGVLGIHSLLEYPLWYAYFLAVAAVLLGMFDETRYRLKLRVIGSLSMATLLVLGLLVLMQLMLAYKGLEKLLVVNPASDANATSTARRDRLVALHGMPFMSPYAELYMAQRMAIDESYLSDKLALNTRVAHFVPIGPVVYRQGLLLAQDGQVVQAETVWNQAIWSYPEDWAEQNRQLSELTQRDPAHFAALLEFSLQKEQERASAIRNK